MRERSTEKIFTKFIRAKAKTSYHPYKKNECWVCGRKENLELHHVYPLAEIIKDYLNENNIVNPKNDEDLREQIFRDLGNKIFNEENLITLCKVHHTNIHRLFGKTYSGTVSEKVKNYLTKQKEKMYGKVH